MEFYLNLYGDREAAAPGVTGVGVAPSEMDEAAVLPDWIPTDSRL